MGKQIDPGEAFSRKGKRVLERGSVFSRGETCSPIRRSLVRESNRPPEGPRGTRIQTDFGGGPPGVIATSCKIVIYGRGSDAGPSGRGRAPEFL